MARKISSLEEQLDSLADLRAQPPSAEGRARLARDLANRSNLVAAKAALIAAEWQSAELIPELLEAFARFMQKPETTDRRCAAKIEILKALVQLEHNGPAVFRRAMSHIQMEPTWGGTADTAGEVRALGAMGLVQAGDPDALEQIVPLLLDPQRDARIGAVRAVALASQPAGALLLRLKALSGDEPEIVGECLAALLRMEPARSLAFAAAFLDHHDEALAETAALSLGGCRLEGAFEILREASQRIRGRSMSRTLLLAIALLRREEAIDYLLDMVENGASQASADAVAALEMYQADPAIQARLTRAFDRRS